MLSSQVGDDRFTNCALVSTRHLGASPWSLVHQQSSSNSCGTCSLCCGINTVAWICVFPRAKQVASVVTWKIHWFGTCTSGLSAHPLLRFHFPRNGWVQCLTPVQLCFKDSCLLPHLGLWIAVFAFPPKAWALGPFSKPHPIFLHETSLQTAEGPLQRLVFSPHINTACWLRKRLEWQDYWCSLWTNACIIVLVSLWIKHGCLCGQPRQAMSVSDQPPPTPLYHSQWKCDFLLPVPGGRPRLSLVTGCNVRTEVHFPLCVVFVQHSLMFPAFNLKMFKLECFLFSSENTYWR